MRIENTWASQPRERDHHDLGDQIGGRDPAAVIDAGADRALDVGQRGVDDLDVEHRHEGAERGADHRDPGLRGDGGIVGPRRAAVIAGGNGIDGGVQRRSWSVRRVQDAAFIQLRGSAPRDARRFPASRSATTVDLVSTVGSADMPGRSRPFRSVVVEHDLDRHALHDLGEVAGGVVGRQQREFEAAGRRQAVDMALAVWSPWKLSIVSSTGWPLRTWVSWVSLKLATT